MVNRWRVALWLSVKPDHSARLLRGHAVGTGVISVVADAVSEANRSCSPERSKPLRSMIMRLDRLRKFSAIRQGKGASLHGQESPGLRNFKGTRNPGQIPTTLIL